MSPQPHSAPPLKNSPWRWIPSLYFAQAIPVVIITGVSCILYKDRGISNDELAFWTAWLYLPWVIKGLWGPLVERFGTRRQWIIAMQFLLGVGFGFIGLLLPLPFWFMATLILFWLLAFASATHDIAADGFYMDALTPHDQVWFSGIRNTAFRIAMVAAQGGLVMFVGWIDETTGPRPIPITLTAPGVETPSLSCLDTIAQTLKENVSVFKGQMPEIYCENPHVIIPDDQVADSANVRILNWVNRWNNALSHQSASQIADSLLALRRDLSQYKTDNPAEKSGRLLIVPYRLTAPPEKGESLTAAVRYESGEKGVKIIAGDWHEFTCDNWLKPAFAVFQYDDAHLPADTLTTYMIRGGNKVLAWGAGIFLICLVYCTFAAYHLFALPATRLQSDVKGPSYRESFAAFFKLPGLLPALAFVLLYRFGEAQLTKIATPFLMDPRNHGGLSLTTSEVGFITGTIGIFCLLLGGILGSFAAARQGLKYWIWPMACAIHLPNAVYLYLSAYQPENFILILGCVAVEQFGYGFGFAGFMLYMLCFVENSPMRTAHYAFLTGFMALGMMVPGMFSGYLEEWMGYNGFFFWIMLSTLPGFAVVAFLKIPPRFGVQQEKF